MEKLAKIQKELKAPKGQLNKFGGYNYRSCEDILEAVKPLLDGAILTLQDEIINIGNRFYVKATATFTDGTYTHSVTAMAREPETKKGMDESQITGMASSYARKYALNGLFCIDDTKDADTMDNTPAPKRKQTNEDVLNNQLKPLSEQAKRDIAGATTLANLTSVYNAYATTEPIIELKEACGKRKAELSGGVVA